MRPAHPPGLALLPDPVLAPLPGVVPVDTPTTAPGLPPDFFELGARFWPRVDAGDLSADVCWLLRGVRHKRMVLPNFSVRGATVAAARVAWELSGRGPLYRVALRSAPHCGYAACVRPSHHVARAQRVGEPHLGLAELLGLTPLPSPPVPSRAVRRLMPPTMSPTARVAAHADASQVLSQESARTPDAQQAQNGRVRSGTGHPDLTALSDLTLAAVLTLLGTPLVVAGTTKDEKMLLRTPWGDFDADDPETALRRALAARATLPKAG